MKPLLLFAACGALLSAQESQKPPTMVRATGEAVVSVHADHACVRLAVIATAGNAERARERNAERGTNLIARLRDLLGPDANVQTANYTLNRNYADGYVANSTIEVRVKDPTVAGKVVDVATKSGVSVIAGVDASALDEQDARSEALVQATARARANAEAITAALGMRVVRVVSAETSAFPASAPPLPAGPQHLAKKRTVPTPAIAAAVEIRSQVTVTVEAAP